MILAPPFVTSCCICFHSSTGNSAVPIISLSGLPATFTALPNTAFYVQSVLPATQEKISDTLPGLAPDRLAVINAAIQQLCAERGCYYLDLNAEFADDAGCLMTDFAQPDGVHLTVSGYSRWVSYLCTHLPYSKNNPYQAGSTYYLSEDMKNLLADIP